MANTIAIAVGFDSTRTKEAHRLGSESSKAEANTWRTFSSVRMSKDGSGTFELVRDGRTLKVFTWGPE